LAVHGPGQHAGPVADAPGETWKDVNGCLLRGFRGLPGGGSLARALRDRLSDNGAAQSGPAFYQMMARLEDAGLAKGWYERKVVAGQQVKERRYRITPAGARTWEGVRDFYFEQARARPRAAAGAARLPSRLKEA
jgi:hypothetical protein